MSGQFNRNDFEQNPANLKKKRSKSEWNTNETSSLCSEDVLSEPEIKEIEDELWLEKHVPKPSKKELKCRARIAELENESLHAPLSKKETKELKKLNKKHKKMYKYRHRDLSSSHFCLKCCLTSLVLVVVIGCVGLFGGYHFFAQPYTGITLFEAFDVLGGLFNADESKIIKQTFDAKTDGDAFFDSLQKSLYLDTSFTVDDLLNLIPQEEGGTGSSSASVGDLFDVAGEPGNTPSDSLTGNPNIDALLKDAKFDFSSLKDFDENNITPVWEITDKSIAGVLQQVILSADKIPAVQESLGGLNIKLENTLAVRQCLISKDANDDTSMQITIQVKIRNLVEDIVAAQDLGTYQGLVKACLPLVLNILPDSIYLNAIATPQADKAPVLGINSINEEVLQRLISTVDTKVLDGEIENTLNSIGNSIFSTIKKIDDIATEGEQHGIIITPSDATTYNGGTIEINILKAAMAQMGITNVTSGDFLLMVKQLHLVDLEHPNDVETYIKNNYNAEKTTSEEQFKASRDNLFSSYGINPEDVQDITAANFIDSFKDIQNKVALNNDKLYADDYNTLKENSKLSDAALGQVMNELIKKELGDKISMQIALLDMKTDYMEIVAKLDVSEAIKAQLGDNLGALEPLILSIFPTNMFVKILVPYDKTAEGFNIIFNYKKYYDANDNLTDAEAQAKSDKMFATVEQIMKDLNKAEDQTNNFSKDALVNKIKDAIYPALDNLNVPDTDITIKLTENGIQFPTVFEILASTVNKDSAEGEKLSASEIRDTLQGYYKYNGAPIGDSIGNNLVDTHLTGSSSSFVNRELTSKFFMKAYIDETNAPKLLSTIGDEEVLTAIKSIATGMSSDNIAQIIDMETMKVNSTPAQQGNLQITALELAKMISTSGDLNQIENIGFYKNFTFNDMSVAVDETSSILSLVMAAQLDDTASGVDGFDINNFATKHLIIQAKVDLKQIVTIGESTDKAYKTVVSINDVQDDKIDNILKIVTKMTGSTASSFDKDSVANNIGKAIYNAFTNFTDQGIELVPQNKVLTNLPNGGQSGFTSTNVYELIGKKTLASYQTGDDDRLRSIICKLNAPNEYTSSEYKYLTQRDDDIVIKDDGSELNLLTIKNTDIIDIHDLYIGRQFKKSVKEIYAEGFDLTRFAILSKPRVAIDDPLYQYDSDRTDFDRVVNSLNIRDLVVTGSKHIDGKDYITDYFSDYADADTNKGFMYMHFRIGKQQLLPDDNSPLKSLLPDSIYSGAFLDMNLGYPVCNYLNDLSKEEMSLLTQLSSSSTITAPVTKAITDILNEDITFTIGGTTYTTQINKIMSFTLYSSSTNTNYANITRSYYEGSLANLM